MADCTPVWNQRISHFCRSWTAKDIEVSWVAGVNCSMGLEMPYLHRQQGTLLSCLIGLDMTHVWHACDNMLWDDTPHIYSMDYYYCIQWVALHRSRVMCFPHWRTWNHHWAIPLCETAENNMTFWRWIPGPHRLTVRVHLRMRKNVKNRPGANRQAWTSKKLVLILMCVSPPPCDLHFWRGPRINLNGWFW